MKSHVAWVSLVLLSMPLSAYGLGFRRSSQPVAYQSFYPAVVYYVPAPIMPVVCPQPMSAVQAPPSGVYATPTPAPPLGSTPPPAGATPSPSQPPPAVKESQAYYDAYGVAHVTGKPLDGQRCSVGFWNHSEQDVVLTVNGQSRKLPRGQSVTMDLPRTFTWQIDQRPPNSETVAADRPGLEIVIRR